MAKNTGSIAEVRKKVTKTYEFISTSHHESGHAIYALLHLMKVSSVSVFQDKKLKRIHGIAYYDYLQDIDTIQDIALITAMARTEIGISYAGLIAEKSLFKSISGSTQIPMFITEGASEDNKWARDLIKKYDLAPPGPKRSLYKRKLMREIRNELHDHWDAVTIVAHELFSHRRLTYEDLRSVLTKKTRNRKFWKEQFKKIDGLYNDTEPLDERKLRATLSV